MTEPTHPSALSRIDSVDVVRGIIMILMALDHTRDYFGDLAANPTNLATASAPLFLTRWITHFCAPTFFLLTGTGAYFSRRQRGTAGLSRFLVTRGIWLVVLEVTVARFLWQFNLDYRVTLLTVLWALGWAMIALGVLVWLPVRAVGILGVVAIATHNLLDGVRADAFGALAPLWTVVHAPGFLVAGPEHFVFAAYVLLPWAGVTAAGYALGAVWELPAERRRAVLARLGVATIAAFVALRGLNRYGDPARWATQVDGVMTTLSFLNTSKYPPSLLFLLMTLGPVLLLLRALDARTPALLRPAQVIGRVPLFYYLLHVLLLHLLALGASLARFGTARPAIESPTLDRFPMTQVPGWPSSLPVVYLVWVAVVLALYPLCRWYARVKRESRSPWLSYL